jgi:uncharacterized protein (DUF1501 family)
MDIFRRRFLGNTGALTAAALVGNLGRWGVPSANAQVVTDYKALVCVFLFGGNDSNNTVVPVDDYAQYAAVRTPASGIALTQAEVLPFAAARQGGKRFGFHPALAPIKPFYDAGKLAVIANAGPLLAPINKADYLAGRNRPPNLYSHSDQQALWQGQLPGNPVRSGWGGRIGDRMLAVNNGATLSTVVSVSGSAVLNQGYDTSPFVIPSGGGVSLSGQGTDAISKARYAALKALLATGGGNEVFDGAAGVLEEALSMAEVANPVLTAALPAGGTIATAFGALNTGIASQLKQAARLIEARTAFGVKRQVFFVSLGGFDHHASLLSNQNTLFGQLAPALKAFYDYTVAAGLAGNVTTFTMSDFSRTFVGNSTQGTDHAWGAHHLVLGGAVRGADIYGSFPPLVLKGNDDAGSNGSWLPTTAVDQIGATLARWFGVPDVDLPYVFPNVGRFASSDLGFMG